MGKGRLVVVSHPYADHLLTILRSRSTGLRAFRETMRRMGLLLAIEISKEIPARKVYVETPLGVKAEGRLLDTRRIVVVAVLRAALPLVEGMLEVFEDARLGLVAARRVEEKGMKPDKTFEIELNYTGIPSLGRDDVLVVADPMLATGSTLVEAVREILDRSGKPGKMVFATVISTRIAVDRLRDRFPDAIIYTVSVDPGLNEKGYIVPGLGDAGDRAFG